jgi:hypothetical protein
LPKLVVLKGVGLVLKIVFPRTWHLIHKVTQLTEEQKKLVGIQQKILDECIRAILYSRKYHQLGINNRNVFIAGCLTKTSVIQWCQLFGSRTEHIHWSKLDLTRRSSPFGRAQILQCTDFDKEEWIDYHSKMTEIRNKFFAHFDSDQLIGHIPPFEPALKILLCYRQWLIDQIDSTRASVKGELNECGFQSNDTFLKDVNDELSIQ